jgi:hypothetical protein
MSDPTQRITDKEYHDVEWAWQLGAGFRYWRCFMDLGFQKGLTYTFTGASNAKSNQFYINVGFIIPLTEISDRARVKEKNNYLNPLE